MIAEFSLATVIIAIIGIVLINNCKNSKKQLKEMHKLEMKALEEIYFKQSSRHEKELADLQAQADELRNQYLERMEKGR